MLAFAGACVVLNLVPGPGMMFITAHGIAGGRRAGVCAALGMASGCAVHTIAAALGLSVLLTAAPVALTAVRVFGAVVLLYMAFIAWRSVRAGSEPMTRGRRRSLRRTYWSAVLTNLSNPKVVLFYVAFVPQFIDRDGWAVSAQILVLGALLIVIGLAMDSVIGIAAGTFSSRLIDRDDIQRWFKRAAATVFSALAVRLLVEATH